MTEKSITAFEDLQFGPLGEGSPVQAALLWGDPSTGPAAVMVKFPQGHAEPWHSHSATYRSVLVKGSVRNRSQGDGDAAVEYGPGAYMVQPGGAVHSEVNAGDGELVALVFFEGPIDFVAAG